MWCLVSPSGEVYHLIPGKIHTVSRKSGDLILSNDQSVSRKHASLEVRSPPTDGVSVWDEKSKYGTFVNQGITYGTKLNADIKATIKEGARVRFGLQELNIWTLKREVPCVCAHMLKTSEKNQIKSILKQFDSKLVDNWTEDSTHLTTNSLRLTYEVMCALACGKPIVSPKYWDDYVLMMTGKGPRVNLAKFIPPLEDNRLQGKDYSCLPNPARKTLFKGKLFIFATSQSMKAYKYVIENAGGKAGKLSDCGMSLDDYCKPHIIILSDDGNVQSSFYNKVLSKLMEMNRRAIPEEDIGLALWKVSTAVHCNPLYSPKSILLKNQESCADQDLGKTLVLNTEEDTGVVSKKNVTISQVIPPSYSESLFSTEDQTLSISFNKGQPNLPVAPKIFSSRKRDRDSNHGTVDDKNKQNGINSKAVKIEPPEEEDLFAMEDEVLRTGTRNTSFNSLKREMRPSTSRDNDQDDFSFPSPKRKKVTKSVEADECDMFDFPEPPPSQGASSNKNNDDEFDFLSDRKCKKLTKTVKRNFQNESRDLFETTQDSDIASSSSSTRGKRKDRESSDSDNPPLKKLSKACPDLTTLHNSKVQTNSSSGFISKNKCVKKEEMGPAKGEDEIDPAQREEVELAMGLSAKVVITSLTKKPQQNKNRNTSVNNTVSSGKNFKKFRKAWSETTTRHHVTVSKMNSLSRQASDSEEEEDDNDGGFLPSRPAPARKKTNQPIADEDNEFALPSMSQFI